MSESRPPRRFMFATEQDADESEYQPPKTRDSELAELFGGERPGIVIAWQQKVGIDAARIAFSNLTDVSEDLRPRATQDLTNVLSYASLGSAYYLYANPSKEERMNRSVELPDMIHRETGERLTEDGLRSQITRNLGSIAVIADDIYYGTRDGQNQKVIQKGKHKLGKQLAVAGVDFAAVRDTLTRGIGSEFQMQEQARNSANQSKQTANNLTKKLGVRPTLAQLPDQHSPLMTYFYTDKSSIGKPAFELLNDAISDARNAALKK